MVTREHATGVATDEEIAAFDERRNRPWSDAHYERVRLAAEAVVRSRQSHPDLNRRGLTIVDGAALWRLIGALSRTTAEDD